MRWIVLLALGTATALIYLVSLRGNYLYGYGLGQTPEKRELFAWANVAADIWKGFGLVAVVLLWREHKRMALVAILAWSVCVATGVNSAIGVYVQDRAELTGMRDAKHATYKDVERELARVEATLALLTNQHSVAEVDAAILAALAKPVIVGERVRGTVGTLSGNCTKVDGRTAEACAEVSVLREERAAALEGARLQSEATRLREQQRELREQGSSLAPDPVGEFWAWATRGLLSVRDVGFGFPLMFALVIEVVSAFGPSVVVAVAAATRAGSSMPQPAPAGLSRAQQAATHMAGDSVLHWLADRTEPTSDPVAITIQALYADYAAWCASTCVHLSEPNAFAAEFDRVRTLPELASKIRKFGDRYCGLRLLRAPVRRIASANDA